MAFSDDIYDKIQRYLDGEMKGEERSSFEQEMAADEALAQEVALHADMQELLADSPENELRHSLQVLGQQATTKSRGGFNRLLWLLLPILLLTGWWFLSEEETNKGNPPEDTVQKPTGLNEQDATTEEVDDVVAPVEEKPLPKQKEKRTVPDKKDASRKNAKESGPIAANFVPNPALEFMIGNNLRADDFQWAETRPQQDVTLSTTDASLDFQFAGRLIAESDISGLELKLHLFSNDPAAFDTFSPLYSFDLTLQEDAESNYVIDFQKSIPLKQGLYYYLIEDYETEQIYRVEKFVARRQD